MSKHRGLPALTAIVAVLAALATGATAQDATLPNVVARMRTAASPEGQVAAGVAVLGDDGVHFIGAARLTGLEVNGPDGEWLGSFPAGEAGGVDVSYGFSLNGAATTLVAAIDTTRNALRLYRLNGAELEEIGSAVPLGFAAENVCLFRNRLDGALYAIVVGDGGEIDQQLIYAGAEGRLNARSVRRLSVLSTVAQCVVDEATGTAYVSEETVGIWRFNANPEAFAAPVLIASPRFGHLGEEVGGLALHDGGEGARWLIASDAASGRLNLYDRDADDAYLGSVTVSAEGGEPLEEPGPLHGLSAAVDGYSNGLLLVTDEDEASFLAVSMADLAAAVGRSAGTPTDPRPLPRPPVPTVMATVETQAVVSFGDAADDPAIWADPENPARSLVVATDKKGGLYGYDMQGRVVQDLRDGKMNNIDLREGFMLGGRSTILVAATNRTDRGIALYTLDPVAQRLTNVADGYQPTELEDPYGLCLYRSPTSGRTYVFVNGDDVRKRQWELVDAGDGRVRADFVREFAFDTQTEGCVADDTTGALYVSEEDVGLWRLDAEPTGETRVLVERIADNPAVKDDYEGVGLYDLGDGRGYIVVSSQGNDSYAVYRREGDQEYLGSFAVAANAALGIDGISETDGLEITSRNLGPGFEHGAMIAQDGRNVLPVENQNYKYVPWQAIAGALNLEMR